MRRWRGGKREGEGEGKESRCERGRNMGIERGGERR